MHIRSAYIQIRIIGLIYSEWYHTVLDLGAQQTNCFIPVADLLITAIKSQLKQGIFQEAAPQHVPIPPRKGRIKHNRETSFPCFVHFFPH